MIKDIKDLKTLFSAAAITILHDKSKVDKLWNNIREQYSKTNRVYHNMKHIGNMVEFYVENLNLIKNKTSFLLAIFIHDLIYVPGNDTNEDDSLKLFAHHLRDVNKNQDIIDEVYELVEATKDHSYDGDNTDIILFIIADLMILASDKRDYRRYMKDIALEYTMKDEYTLVEMPFMEANVVTMNNTIYPLESIKKSLEDSGIKGRKVWQGMPLNDYVEGRIAFLKTFLERESIFSNPYFYSKFGIWEIKARENAHYELDVLEFYKSITPITDE